MATSLWSRKADFLYTIFFILHIPTMLSIDLVPLYPAAVRPILLDRLRAWYISVYQDRFFMQPPPWFVAYIWLEAVYHLPLSVWAIRALIRDDAKVPLNLLPFSILTAVTTMTCVVQMMSWDLSRDAKITLSQLYVPYFLIAACMGIDMYRRLDQIIGSRAVLQVNGDGKMKLSRENRPKKS